MTAQALANQMLVHIAADEALMTLPDGRLRYPWRYVRREAMAWEMFLCRLAGSLEIRSDKALDELIKSARSLAAKVLNPLLSVHDLANATRTAKQYKWQCRRFATSAHEPKAILEEACRAAAGRFVGVSRTHDTDLLCLELAKASLGDYKAIFTKTKRDLSLD